MELVKASARLSATALGYSTLKKCSKLFARKILIHIRNHFFVSVSHFSVPTFSMTPFWLLWHMILSREIWHLVFHNVARTPQSLYYSNLALGPSSSDNKIAGAALGRGLRVDSSRANAGMLALVLDFNNCQLAVIKINKTELLTARLKRWVWPSLWRSSREKSVDGNDVFVTMLTGYGKSYWYMLLPAAFEQLRSTFNYHPRLSIDSADYGTGLHKTDASWLSTRYM